MEKGYKPVVVDNLSRGNREAIEQGVAFYEGSVGDRELINKIMEENPFSGVIHFAAFISMKESMENPKIYFEDNTFQTLQFLEILQ